MARKSRSTLNKAGAEVKSIVQTIKYQTAVYARLSRENEETQDRGTINNQINLVRNFIKEQDDMEIYRVYMDDDITGTTFERPAFNEMMEDMRKGRINCIVVKDLSRLGRDYVETGNLLERVFPMFGLRFISLLDHYDSSRDGFDIMIPVTNIANALYSQDISKKIKTAKWNKIKQGIPVGNVAYGYKVVIDENGNRKMVVDEEAGAIVRRIFREAYEGKSNCEIADGLNREGIATPYQYRFRKHPEKLENRPYLRWTRQLIYTILRKEVYTGKYVVGKDMVCLYRHEKRHHTQETEWLVFENHHDPLVTKEVFAYFSTGDKRNNDKKDESENTRESGAQHENLLRRKVVCGYCGSSMHMRSVNKSKVYECTHKSVYGKQSCSSKWVKVGDVYETVLSVLKESMQLFMDHKEVIRQMNVSEKGRKRKRMLAEAIGKNQMEIKKCENLKEGLYCDYLEQVLDEKDYLRFSKEYSVRIKKLTDEIQELQKAADLYEKNPTDAGNLTQMILSYSSSKKLSKELVDAFIDKVVVYENRNLEIVLRFQSELEELEEIRKQMEAELS